MSGLELKGKETFFFSQISPKGDTVVMHYPLWVPNELLIRCRPQKGDLSQHEAGFWVSSGGPAISDAEQHHVRMGSRGTPNACCFET